MVDFFGTFFSGFFGTFFEYEPVIVTGRYLGQVVCYSQTVVCFPMGFVAGGIGGGGSVPSGALLFGGDLLTFEGSIVTW